MLRGLVEVSVAGAGGYFGLTPTPELLFGLMLAGALVGGYAARLMHLPRVVGYLLAGVGLRAGLQFVFAGGEGSADGRALEEAAEPLDVIRDLALGIILFVIGGFFERSQMRAAGRRVMRISAAEIAATTLLVFAGCSIVAVAVPSDMGVSEGLSLALLLSMAAIATAPAATLIVLQEYEAKGPITDTILGLTAVNNVVCIVMFHATFLLLAAVGVVQAGGSLTEHVGIALAVTTLGSFVVGVSCGTVLSICHAKLPTIETLLVFFSMFLLLGAGEKWMQAYFGCSYNFLLSSLVLGGVFANLAIDPQKLNTTLRTAGAPILAGFFVIAGYGLHLGDLKTMSWIGAAYIACRMLGKWAGCKWGVRVAGGPGRADGRLGGALLCQAAVVIGLASFVDRSWDSPVAKMFSTVVLGSVVVFELIGPLMVKRCVVSGGEVKAITLMGRLGPATEGNSIVKMTLQSLWRLLSFGSNGARAVSETMSVRHVMRTHVQLIPAAAAFDEVLHLIERSTYSHFPVVHEDGAFAGVIHFSDIRDVIYDPNLRELVTAVDLADSAAPTLPMDMPLADALEVFSTANVAVMAVADGAESKRVVGVIEMRDVLKALHLSQKSDETS